MKSLVKVSSKIKLLIVGDGPDIKQYQDYSNKNNLNSNVIFTGKVPWNNINEYYLLADVFATASHTETQGLTVIEAMAASLPVICINDESFTDTVVNGLNGMVFDNRREYKKCIISLYRNRELLKKLSNQARISAETNSSKYFAEQILDVYKIAIKNKPKHRIPIVEKISNLLNKIERKKKCNNP